MLPPGHRELAAKEDEVLLEQKNAVIYGGAGRVGGAVARAFAREGALVHLAGRTKEKLCLLYTSPSPRDS